jgi:predicted transport protein
MIIGGESMADIKLFSLKGQVKELNSNQVPLEKELQQLLEQNMSTFFGVTFLKSEYRITNGRMDSIGIDENNCPVIFEYKRSVNENVINQGLFYLDWLLDHKADFKLLVMDILGSEQADKIDWSMPCVICVANDFTKFDEHAVNQMQRNIKLVKYKKFGNDLISLEYLNAPQVQPIEFDDGFVKQTKKSNSKDKDFDQYFNEAGIKNQNLFYSVRDYILSLGDDVSENRLKLYVAFKKVRNIICAEVYRNNVCLHLRLNPDTVDLAQGFIEDVRNKGHWGTGDLRINLKSVEDFEKAKPLLDRAYNEN